MRTTLTLEDDVAAQLMRVQRQQRRATKDIVNEALRRGLREMSVPARSAKKFVTRPLPLGECLVPSLDNIGELLETFEDERLK